MQLLIICYTKITKIYRKAEININYKEEQPNTKRCIIITTKATNNNNASKTHKYVELR